MPSSPVVSAVLLQFVGFAFGMVMCLVIFNPMTNAFPAAVRLQLRDTYSDPTRFFLPDALLADKLLSSAGPIHSFRPAVFVRSVSPVKRYFDSLAGQSLGKRSAAPRGTIEDGDEQSDALRTMRFNFLRPGWQMW